MFADSPELRKSFDVTRCSIKRTVDVIGDPWTLMILREAFWGVRRFQDFQRYLGLPRAVLVKRLEKLIEHGIFQRSPYQERGARVRYEYVLTEAGQDLFVPLLALNQWGDEHLGNGPIRTVERGSGTPVSIRIVDDHGAAVRTGQTRAVLRDSRPSPMDANKLNNLK